jgi:hypothetical protein
MRAYIDVSDRAGLAGARGRLIVGYAIDQQDVSNKVSVGICILISCANISD